MGLGQSKNNESDEATFRAKGPANFVYDEITPVFPHRNGLLFQLKNTEGKQRAYYNDTSKYEFHITGTFGPGSTDLVALGKTSLVELPEGGWVAKTVVYPGLTEPFVQGNVVGYDSSIDAVLLTNEYREKRREEKSQAKKEEKRRVKEAKRQAKYGNDSSFPEETGHTEPSHLDNVDELGNPRREGNNN